MTVEPGPVGPARTATDRSTTGHADVDAALARLDELDARPVADHVTVYEDVQQRLAETMSQTQDPRPGAGPG